MFNSSLFNVYTIVSMDRKEIVSGSLERKPILSFESSNSFTYIKI